MRYLLLLVSLFFFSCHSGDIPRVLIFSKTEGYRHDCIPTATDALRKMCNANGIAVDTTEDAGAFHEANLKRYSAVIFRGSPASLIDSANCSEICVRCGSSTATNLGSSASKPASSFSTCW